MFKIEENDYELKYDLKRIELIEQATGTSMMSAIASTRGMMGILQLKNCFCYGLKSAGSDTFVQGKKAAELFEKALTEHGYAGVVEIVIDAIQRDCPFFFQAD